MVLLVPPVRQFIGDSIGYPLPLWLRSLAISVFIVLYILLIFKGMGNKHSIYKNSEIEQGLMAIYDRRMTEWPVPYEERFLDTVHGRVYVVLSGPVHQPHQWHYQAAGSMHDLVVASDAFMSPVAVNKGGFELTTNT